MTGVEFCAFALGVSVVAGAVGTLFGLGGGVIIVPALVAVGVDLKVAIGASAVAVVANSCSGAARSLRDGMAHLRVSMFLEVATVSGALCGALLAGVIDDRFLYLTFAAVLTLSAVALLLKNSSTVPAPPSSSSSSSSSFSLSWATRFGLVGVVVGDDGVSRPFAARRAPLALALMLVAGVTSGMLGIGSGVLKVLAMDLAMGLPVKVSSASSNLMIGVTAASTAAVCALRGDVVPVVVAPVVVGVVGGSVIGARLLRVLPAARLRGAFVIVVVLIALQMARKGFA